MIYKNEKDFLMSKTDVERKLDSWVLLTRLKRVEL